MSTSKHFDKICCIILTAVLLLTALFFNAQKLGVQAVSAAVGYASRLFNTATVHTIDIVMDDWDSFIENCNDEQYADCTVIIDGEAYRNVAIRAKGNTSLTSVESYGNNRYSFKIEFDHYDDAISYYGLDKLCLNNIIQDNTYMKDYLTYRLMQEFGADAPLCSYSYITVNGNDWGLYLAVEGVEDSFLQRSYGNNYGQLYKPDSMSMGGGRGNGREFDMDNFKMPDMPTDRENAEKDSGNHTESGNQDTGRREDNHALTDRPDMKGSGEINILADKGEEEHGISSHAFSRGSNDVSLIYTDDEFDSYSNIFDNAKTDLSDADKTRLIESIKKLNNNEDIENIVDVDEVIRYFVVHNFVLNFDSYTGNMIHNYYLYEDNGQLSMIPWDYNLAFGGFESQSNAAELVNYPIDTPVSGGTVDSRPMLAWIFNDEKYTDLYHQYFVEFITEYFDSGKFDAMVDSAKELIAPYVESDPTKFCAYEEFENSVSTLKDFCALRAESVNGQLDGTIPATTTGQTQDSSALIDADGITIADMGNMGQMGGGFARNNERFNNRDSFGRQEDAIEAFNPQDDFVPLDGSASSDVPSAPNAFNPPDESPAFNAFASPNDSAALPGNFTPPDMQNGSPANFTVSLILLGVSIGILILGLATAFLFRRRR
ncbi:MAG: CotH kinase family protein [Eubacterium sp.]|nr:CotH kinase family protein [Eubacterium sp.]